MREAAAARLAAIRAASAGDPAAAARQAKELLRQVRDTGLEEDVQAFLESLSG